MDAVGPPEGSPDSFPSPSQESERPDWLDLILPPQIVPPEQMRAAMFENTFHAVVSEQGADLLPPDLGLADPQPSSSELAGLECESGWGEADGDVDHHYVVDLDSDHQGGDPFYDHLSGSLPGDQQDSLWPGEDYPIVDAAGP